MLTKGNFTRDEWNHLVCLFNISHFISAECSDVMSKRTQKDSGEERVTAKSKPMMNLVSRCSERTPDVLSSTASESLGKTRHESQTPLSPQTEMCDRTGRPVVCAHSSSYSEWNIDKIWSSQEWKSDELMDERTERPVVSSQHADRFIIENDETNSYAEAESDLSLGSRAKLVTDVSVVWFSEIHHTSDHRQYCHVGNTAQQCRLGLFQDPDFAGDLKDSKSTSEGVLCIFGSRTFVPISCMCKKQTSVSHSSTESEIISLDAGLRMDGLPALDLWNVVIEVSRSSKSTESPNHGAARNCYKPKPKEKENQDVDQLSNVDYVTTNANSSQGECQLYIFEDNEAMIKMIIKGRSPTMRHVSRYHRVAFDWSFDRISLDAKIQSKYVDTKKPNSRTCAPKVVFHVMIGITFPECFPAAMFFQTESRVSCPRELRKARLKRVRRWRNRDRWVWC